MATFQGLRNYAIGGYPDYGKMYPTGTSMDTAITQCQADPTCKGFTQNLGSGSAAGWVADASSAPVLENGNWMAMYKNASDAPASLRSSLESYTVGVGYASTPAATPAAIPAATPAATPAVSTTTSGSVTTPVAGNPSKPSDPPKKSSWSNTQIALVVLIVLLVLAGLGYALFYRRRHSKRTYTSPMTF